MKPQFIFLIGLSGSGKSTWAQRKVREEGINWISSDNLRQELFGDRNDQNHNSQVFDVLHKRVIGHLKKRESVIYDSTGLSASRRTNFLKQISRLDCEKKCVVFATPLKTCIERDSSRGSPVGESVIRRQLKQFQAPHESEGWDEIIFVRGGEEEGKEHLLTFFFQGEDTPHDCAPHHLETIQEHMKMCANLAVEKRESNDLIAALLLHDVGKFFTKEFQNTRGEKTDQAHYYSHENVSAYLFLTSREWDTYQNNKYILYLIQYHMRPYFQGYDKFSKGLPENLVKDLDLMYKYDQLGRIRKE